MGAEIDIKQLAIVRDEVAAPRPRRHRHLLSRYVIPGILLVGFLSLVAWASRDRLSPPKQVWVVPVLATQSAAQMEGTPLFQAAGWIEPRPTPIRAAALAQGVVERLLVVEDQPVKAGEPIAELVKQDAQLACDNAAANLKLSEAELTEARAGLEAATTRFEQPVHLQASLGEAEATLAAVNTELKNLPFETRRAEAQLEFAAANYEGKRNSAGAVSGRAIKEAKSDRDAAQALVEELQNRVESLTAQKSALVQRRDALRTQLDLRTDEKQAKEENEARLQAALARVEQARVALAEANLRLDRMTVRSPVAGRVYKLVAFPGTTLSGGMGTIPTADGSTVVTLYQPEMLQVRADVRFADIPKVALGQTVLINNPALSKPIAGKVLYVGSEANIQKNTLGVKVGIEHPAEVLKPEMLVDVTYLAPKPPEAAETDSNETHLFVPRQLVQTDEAGTFVWVADQSEGLARKTPIQTGNTATGGLVEVASGLTLASRIISRGYETLSDGARIEVVSEDSQFAHDATASAEQPLSRLPHDGEPMHGAR
jgi:multidrug efflux pump subunit AcrA (membrane-fusion protein)